MRISDWSSDVCPSDLAFSMCPLLNQGAIDMLLHHASEEHKETYLPKMVTGEWTGTMNLTEPQAGSDVGALTTKAVPQGDGTYRISGTKIFISFGEHDRSEEHTSELQSLMRISYAVFCLKKKIKHINTHKTKSTK